MTVVTITYLCMLLPKCCNLRKVFFDVLGAQLLTTTVEPWYRSRVGHRKHGSYMRVGSYIEGWNFQILSNLLNIGFYLRKIPNFLETKLLSLVKSHDLFQKLRKLKNSFAQFVAKWGESVEIKWNPKTF